MSVTYEITQITGGAYVAASDWSAQFDDASAAGYLQTSSPPSSEGEFSAPFASCGRRARLAVFRDAPTTVSFYIENDGGGASGIQLQVAGVIIGEYTSGTSGTFDLKEGVTIVAMMWEKGQACLFARFVCDSVTARPTLGRQYPLYSVGSVGGVSMGTPISPGGGPGIG